MRKTILALLCAGILCQGCVSTSVRNGALIGAASGAAVGSGLGYAASDENLLGSKQGGTGPMALPATDSVLTGLLVGTLFGALIGSVVGNSLDDPDQDAYEANLEARAAADTVQRDFGEEDAEE